LQSISRFSPRHHWRLSCYSFFPDPLFPWSLTSLLLFPCNFLYPEQGIEENPVHLIRKPPMVGSLFPPTTMPLGLGFTRSLLPSFPLLDSQYLSIVASLAERCAPPNLALCVVPTLWPFLLQCSSTCVGYFTGRRRALSYVQVTIFLLGRN